MKVRLAIVEDQSAIREALSTYLGAQAEFECSLVVESVEVLLAAGAPKPRLVLSDIGLPGVSDDGIALLREQAPQAEVVLITVYQDADRAFKALCAGAVGYLVKSTPLPAIKQALLDVLAGGSPMSPAIARHVMRYFRPAPVASGVGLTPREQQIVEALEQGLSYKLVADRLGISLNTVRAYIRSVYDKLRINSKAELLSRKRHN
ncbi:response regulator [Hymenobacter cavernae]|uniref:DNA-binding response regulator n=1 Tax=Hymenobacter cavernae TaxID=2044852 RepID=A0ABQ1UPB3_9BACT|nr:response regulator transcription factor [Hymenobacter cavernae]GGF21841.1 DNA-binding response regulator [Hymenobacter cavernae]